MPDCSQLVLEYLLQDDALVALCPGGADTVDGAEDDIEDHIVAGELPQYSDPNNYAPFVTIQTEGGKGHPEAPYVADRVKIRVWAGINDYPTARAVYQEIWDWLDRKTGIDLSPDGFIMISQELVRGQDLTDPDTGFATVLSYYQITARDSVPAIDDESGYGGGYGN